MIWERKQEVKIMYAAIRWNEDEDDGISRS
jgi:hypothetical protein